MSDDRYGCPMCHGEGKISWKVFEDTNAPQRIIAYGVAALGILIGSAILYHTTAPREPLAIELCSKSCGDGKFKTYLDPRPQWTEHVKGMDPDIDHPPVPATCQCFSPEELRGMK